MLIAVQHIHSLIITLVLLATAITAEYEQCNRKYDKSNGKCVTVIKCPKIVDDFRFEGIRLQPCAKDSSNQDLFCCPVKYLNIQDTQNRVGEDSSDISKRISTIKCKKYSELVSKKFEISPLLLVPSVVEFSVAQCDTSEPLVVGGTAAKFGEFPHMVALGWTQVNGKINYNCGGSIISERFILTAAHCAFINSVNPDIVRIGDVNLVSDNDGARPQNYFISDVIRHPQYKSSSKYNDIALIKVQNDMIFSSSIRPACLWIPNKIDSKKCTAIGWGTTEYAGDASDDLLKVGLDIIDQRYCKEIFAERGISKLANGVIDSQICAGVLTGGKDTCQGDSGGPLQISLNNNQCASYLIGITSFGIGCGAPGEPGVYTRVSSYVDWIESIVWPNNN